MGDQPIVLMLAGLPGTGKSTLALALAEQLRWPVLDKDLLNAVLLEADLEQTLAGPLAYELVFALAHALVVRQRQSVILDTAGRQPAILERARLIAEEGAGHLKIVRLRAPQVVRRERLARRIAGPSQWTHDTTTVEQEEAWYAHLPGDTLLLPADQPIEKLLPLVRSLIDGTNPTKSFGL